MKTILVLVLALFSISSFARVYDCSVTASNNDEKLSETFQFDNSVDDARFVYLEAKSSQGAPLYINFLITDKRSAFMSISTQNIDSTTTLNSELGKTTKLKTSDVIGGGGGINWALEMSCTVVSQ